MHQLSRSVTENLVSGEIAPLVKNNNYVVQKSDDIIRHYLEPGFQCKMQLYFWVILNNAFQKHNLFHVSDTSKVKHLFCISWRFSSFVSFHVYLFTMQFSN